MTYRARKFANYLSVDLPPLAPSFPIPSSEIGKPLHGALPLLRRGDPISDPDAADAPVGNLYTHPSLPGLMLSTVQSVEELFRKGSSFVIQSSATGKICGLFGASAENVVLGGRTAVVPGVEAPIPGITMLTAQELLEYTQLFRTSDNVPSAGQVPYLTSENVGGFMPGVRFDSIVPNFGPVGAAMNTVRGRVCDFSYTSGNNTNNRLMAVYTTADDGWAFVPSVVESLDGLGTTCVLISVGTVMPLSGVIERDKERFLASLPSEVSKFGPRAWADEFRYLKANDYSAEFALVTAMRKDAGVDKITASTGFGIPSLRRISSAVFQFLPLFPRKFIFPGTSYSVHPVDGYTDSDYSLLRSKHLWATCAFRGNDLVPSKDPVAQDVNYRADVPMGWAEYLAFNGAAVEGAKLAVDVGTAVYANGQDVVSGGLTVRVPTAKGAHDYNGWTRTASENDHYCRLGFLAREFYRRALIRVEQYARAS